MDQVQGTAIPQVEIDRLIGGASKPAAATAQPWKAGWSAATAEPLPRPRRPSLRSGLFGAFRELVEDVVDEAVNPF